MRRSAMPPAKRSVYTWTGPVRRPIHANTCNQKVIRELEVLAHGELEFPECVSS